LDDWWRGLWQSHPIRFLAVPGPHEPAREPRRTERDALPACWRVSVHACPTAVTAACGRSRREPARADLCAEGATCDDGCGIDRQILRAGQNGHPGSRRCWWL